MVLTELESEELLRCTQYRVDSHRRLLDDCYRQLIELGVEEEDFNHINSTMIFTGDTKSMLDECIKRGLEVNTNRQNVSVMAYTDIRHTYWLKVGEIIGKGLVDFTTYESAIFEGALRIPGDVATRIMELQEENDSLRDKLK